MDARKADLQRIDELFNAMADDAEQIAVFFGSYKDPLRWRKLRCDALRPHDFALETFRPLPGFQRLRKAFGEAGINAELRIAVCHFKPGPDQDGLYRTSNPEAVVIVAADPEKNYADSAIHVYADKHTGRHERIWTPEDIGNNISIRKPLRFSAKA